MALVTLALVALATPAAAVGLLGGAGGHCDGLGAAGLDVRGGSVLSLVGSGVDSVWLSSLSHVDGRSSLGDGRWLSLDVGRVESGARRARDLRDGNIIGNGLVLGDGRRGKSLRFLNGLWWAGCGTLATEN